MVIVNSSLVGILEDYLDKADKMKERLEVEREDSVIKIVQQLLSQLPEEWTQKTETENNVSWTDMYDHFHPAYTVSIRKYSGRTANLEFIVSQRIPYTDEPDCAVSSTYELGITDKGVKVFILKHLTNYNYNSEGSIVAQKVFDFVNKKYSEKSDKDKANSSS